MMGKTYTPRETRIVRLADTDIYRVEVWQRARWWHRRSSWVAMMRLDDHLCVWPWEGSYSRAVAVQKQWIADAWEVIHRDDGNWTTVDEEHRS